MKANPMLNSAMYIAKEYFTYEINLPAPLVAGANANGYVTIDKDSDFFWQKATAHVTVGNQGTTRQNEQIPEVDIIITNTTSGRAIMNTQVPIRNIFGTGEIPFILPIETYFGATSQIACTFYNVSANLDYSTVKISFIGIKAFSN
jgi:hypothetical protein